MKPLYQIVDSLRSIFDRLEESGGEITPEIAIDLSAVEGDFTKKVESIALRIKEKEGEADQVDGEIKRLDEREKSIAREIASLKSYLHDQLIRANETKVKTPLVTVWRQCSSPSVNVLNPNDIPSKYKTGQISIPFESIPPEWKYIAEIKIDRKAISEDLKQGPVPGAELLPAKEFMQIR